MWSGGGGFSDRRRISSSMAGAIEGGSSKWYQIILSQKEGFDDLPSPPGTKENRAIIAHSAGTPTDKDGVV